MDGRANEAKLNAKVVIALNTKIPRTLVWKRRAGPFQKGRADICGVSHGVHLELEGKLPGNRPTEKQKQWLGACGQAGSIIGVFFSVEDALQCVREGLRARGIEVHVSIDPSK